MFQKKSYTCEKLGKTLNFLPDKVNFCCSYAEGPCVEYKKNEIFNMDKLVKTEKKYIKELKYGNIPSKCSGCIDYKEVKHKNIFNFLFSKQDSFLVKEIIVNHFKQCDCNCIYCAQKIIWGEELNQNYELLPIIRDLYKNDAIDKEALRVEFQGGNVSALDEFEPLMREFLDNGCKNFSILTNCINYLPIVEEASRHAVVSLQISLDCGTKETFNRIKQVDAFDNVIKNIKQFSIKTNAIINLKYIIINGINDNTWEIYRFLDTVKALRCITGVSFDIDYRDILLDKTKEFKVPEHYYDLINRAKAFCDENRINFTVSPYAQQYMEKNRKE